MAWSNRKNFLRLVLVAGLCILASCKISYKFNGSSIDYTVVKTITIEEFPNRAPLVVASLSSDFTEKLKDEFSSKTSLVAVEHDGDLQITGYINGYNVVSSGVNSSGEAVDSRLQMSVSVRFVNKANPSENFERSFSSYQTFSNQYTIDEVQGELNETLIEDIVSQIFNATVANW